MAKVLSSKRKNLTSSPKKKSKKLSRKTAKPKVKADPKAKTKAPKKSTKKLKAKKRVRKKKEPPPFDPSRPMKDVRDETICNLRVLHCDWPQSRLYQEAGWNPGSIESATVLGSRKLSEVNVQARIEYLLSQRAKHTISTVQERKEILTEIHRGTLQDFGTCGADGFIPNVGPENINSHALSEVETKTITEGEGDGAQEFVVTKLKLRDPIKAISELNKMEGVYPDKTKKHQIFGAISINLNFGGESDADDD